MFRRPIALLALVLAAALVVNPLYLSFWHTQYSHSVDAVAKSDVPEEADVLAHEDLSVEGQQAVRKAIENGGSYVVYRRANVPEEFFYSDYANLGQGLYYVQYEGDYYRLYTGLGGGFPFVYWFYESLLAAFGLALGVVGYRTYRGGSSWPALGLAIVGVALLLGGPLARFPVGEGVWQNAVMVSALLGGAVAVGLRRRGDPAKAT